MAAPVWQSTTTNGSTGSTVTGNKPASVASGDLLIAVVHAKGDNVLSVSAVPSGWTLIHSGTITGGQVLTLSYWKIAGGSEPSTYAWTLTGATSTYQWSAAISRITGTDQTTPINTKAIQSNASSTSVTCPTVTTTVADCLLMATGADDNGRQYSAPGTMIERWEHRVNATYDISHSGATETLGAATSTGPRVFTLNAPNTSVGSLIAISPPVPVGAVLVGSTTVSLTATGTLTTSILLTGSGNVTLTPTASLTTEIVLVGATNLAITTAGELTTEILLTGVTSIALDTAGEVTTEILLTGTSPITVAAAGDLSTSITLAGSSEIAITPTGELTTAIQLTGDTTVSVTSEAQLTTEINLQSTNFRTIALTITGDLTTANLLQGAIDVSTSVTGALTTAILLNGETTIGVTCDAQLTTEINLQSTNFSTIAVAISGDLTTDISLVGDCGLSITAQGTLTIPINLAGNSDITLTANAELTTGINLTGNANISLAITGTLTGPEQALQLYDTSRRNVMIWEDCGTESTLEKICRCNVHLTNSTQQNAGLVLNYHLVDPLTNPRINYFVAQINRNSNKVELLRYNGSTMVTENTASPGVPFSLDDWYEIKVTVTGISPGSVLISVRVENVTTPGWPVVSFSVITSRWGEPDGFYGIHTTRAVSNFSCWELSDA